MMVFSDTLDGSQMHVMKTYDFQKLRKKFALKLSTSVGDHMQRDTKVGDPTSYKSDCY